MPTFNTRSMAGLIDTRFADVAPASYNANDHTFDCVISMGSPVKRFYGTEVLRISPQAVDLTRLESGGIPFLDHHSQDGIDRVLGRFTETWFKRGALMGRAKFAQTPQGQKAEGMVARGEIAGISAGYRVEEWEITDVDGKVIDPDKDRVRFDDELTFTATRWQLFEASLVGVPADAASSIRSFGSGKDRPMPEIDELARGAIKVTKRFGDMEVTYEYPRATSPLTDIRARMEARQVIVIGDTTV
jgi:phage head maturation protease